MNTLEKTKADYFLNLKKTSLMQINIYWDISYLFNQYYFLIIFIINYVVYLYTVHRVFTTLLCSLSNFQMHSQCVIIGFGLSIAGGTDKPQHPDDPLIYITNVVPGGVAAQDGRLQYVRNCLSQVLICEFCKDRSPVFRIRNGPIVAHLVLCRVNDIVVSVNDVPTVNVTNAEAIGALRKSTTVMKLVRSPRLALLLCLNWTVCICLTADRFPVLVHHSRRWSSVRSSRSPTWVAASKRLSSRRARKDSASQSLAESVCSHLRLLLAFNKLVERMLY